MSTTPSELNRINLKLNIVLYLIGLLVFIVFISFVVSAILRIGTGRSNSVGPLWEYGRPFEADFDGSPEQRKLVDRARTTNGTAAAKIDLHTLNLSGLALTQDDIRTLAGMNELRELNLRKTNIKDEDLAQLNGLWRLESLDLTDTGVSDASLPNLQRFGRLRSLELAGTKITAQGVQTLHSIIPQLRAQLYGYRSNHNGNCVTATLGKIILVKYGDERIAFKFTELTKSGEGGAKYVWCWQPESGAKFQDKTLKSGEGEVFEKYRGHKDAEGNTVVENDGGVLHMQMGPAKLEWSKPLTVYYPNRWDGAAPVLFAFTPWERVEDVNFDDPSLKWYEKTDGNW